jgi:hypothetical protein
MATVPAVGLMPIQSPLGFSILVPSGWILKPVPQAPNVLVFSAPGGPTPSIYIVPAFRVSDLRFQAILGRCSAAMQRSPLLAPDAFTGCVQPAVRSPLADSSRGWAPEAAFRAMLVMLGAGQNRFGAPQITPTSPTSARFSVPAASMGRKVQDWGFVSTAYLSNPLLAQPNGQDGVTTLAFVSGCSDSPAEADSFTPACAAALRSFHPTPEWSNRLVQDVYGAYMQEYQILLRVGDVMASHLGVREANIARFGATMQYSTHQTIQAESLRSNENWIATLGNNVNLRDAATGRIYVAPAGQGSYCLNAAGNEVLMGAEVAPGKYAGKNPANACSDMLQPAR